MPNPRLASRYAKSLIDLATENGQLETVYADMKYLYNLCKSSQEFVTILKSPVITSDKKSVIVEAVTGKNITELTKLFNRLLISKGREFDLPEIVNAFLDQYNQIKGILKVKLTTATEISDAVKKNIEAKVKAAQGNHTIELDTKVREDLIGGFVLEFNNQLVDASIARDLRDVKKQFSKNTYISNLR